MQLQLPIGLSTTHEIPRIQGLIHPLVGRRQETLLPHTHIADRCGLGPGKPSERMVSPFDVLVDENETDNLPPCG